MSDELKEIECDEHGPSYATFMCCHLVTGSGLGFYCATEDDDPYPDAWCGECDQVLLEEKGWNDRSEAFAHIMVVCHNCYLDARARNQMMMAKTDFAALLQESCEYLKTRMEQVEVEYKLSSYERFDFDDDSDELIFSSQGTPKIIAKYQVVGTISSISNTWLWSWANENIPEETKSLIRCVRSFGETNALDRLTTAKWNADEVDGWEMTSVAAKLVSAEAAYRAPIEHLFIFVILTEIRWAEAP